MKLYKRFKKMKTSAKLGLVGTALYAATLAAPLYAAVRNEIKQPVQPVNLEQITTREQVNKLYKEKLVAYASDKLLNHDEINNLYEIKVKENKLLDTEKDALKSESYEKFYKKLNDLENRIQDQKNITGFKTVAVLDEVRAKLWDGVLKYYPGLVNPEKSGIVYSSQEIIKEKLNPIFRDILIEGDRILQKYYNDDSLKIIIEQKNFTINDVLATYDLIDRENYSDKVKEAKIKSVIKSFEDEKNALINSPEKAIFDKKIKSIENLINENSNVTNYYLSYINQKIFIDEFEKKYGNFNKEFSVSVYKEHLLKKKGLSDPPSERLLIAAQESIDMKNKLAVSNLESYLKSQNLDVKVQYPDNPAKTLVPVIAGNLIALFFPVLRNILVKAYVKGNKAEIGDYMATSIAGLINGSLGTMLLDALHPLVFPARMLSPLVIQPAFKILKYDPTP